jgi:hypothetical protein
MNISECNPIKRDFGTIQNPVAKMSSGVPLIASLIASLEVYLLLLRSS